MSQPHRVIPLVPDRSATDGKIHARAVTGLHTRWRWAMVWITQLVFYGLPWLTLDGHQAVLFDLEHERFHLFGAVLYPQDLIYLTGLLVISALLLFFATTVAGRVWCGFSCPQTVYTELFMWIEHRCEGDRRARQRLDQSPWNADKLLRRGGKHLAWGTLSLWTGFTLVGYFTPIHSLALAVPAATLGPWEGFWTLFYGLATYGNAGFLREKVCQHMCPYGRFQGSMLDRDTLIVAYDHLRGEPRGARARGSDAAARGLGACVDCTLCVQVCPVGIDIRQGLQAACISCGVCIDACDPVMDKLGAPRGLIRWATQREMAGEPQARRSLRQQLARPRVLIYGGLLGLVSLALVVGLLQRPTLRLNAMRDRGVMARQVEDGRIENVYRLQAMNASATPRELQLQVRGPDGLALASDTRLQLAPAEARTVSVTVQLEAGPAQALAGQIVPIRFELQDLATGTDTALADSTLVVPR
ncbi:cytochrome c oxidase accessory protein FixG [Sphaerotilus hippei]|uniref:Cytochrome c oxidase accessory protein FixG n=1 Tax=Sphaerotilus hippei TaxID=744406 RepID=A0A318H750_9BURK|nr:cytochrome c oxidase accessory protein CcoG [Sphaerotilus hippei]PXW97455.1 cytochrome c oxidase accessory protein FixG [Sphaerotilus hippei]